LQYLLRVSHEHSVSKALSHTLPQNLPVMILSFDMCIFAVCHKIVFVMQKHDLNFV